MKTVKIFFILFIAVSPLLSQHSRSITARSVTQPHTYNQNSDRTPNFPQPDPYTWVVDQAGVLKDKARISEVIGKFEVENKTTVEIGVVTVASLEGLSHHEYALQLFNRWGIGKKGADNGILILIAPNDRNWAIATGYGLEDVFPDGLCSRIGYENIDKNEFRAGIYDPSIIRILNAIYAEMGGLSLEEKKADVEKQKKVREEMEAKKAEWENRQDMALAKKREEAWNNLIEGAMDLLAFLLGIGLLVGLCYLLYRWAEKRDNAIKGTKEIKAKISALIDLISKSNLHDLLDYSIVVNLLKKIPNVKDNAHKKYFWTKDLLENTKHLQAAYNELKHQYDEVIGGIECKRKISEIADSIKKTDISKWNDQTILQDLFKEIEASTLLDLDDNIIVKYSDLRNKLYEVSYLMETKERLNNQIKATLASELSTTFLGHPGVKEFISTLATLENLDIAFDLPEKFESFLSNRYSLEKDIQFRKLIMTYEESFIESENLSKQALQIIEQLALSESTEFLHLIESAKDKFKQLNEIRNTGNIDARWSELKAIYTNIQKNIELHRIEVEKILVIEKKFNDAKMSYQILTKIITQMVNDGEYLVSKVGVSRTTRNKYKDFVKSWKAQLPETNSLSTYEIIEINELFLTLKEQINQILKTASRENEEHLEELEKERKRREQSEADTLTTLATAGIALTSSSTSSSSSGNNSSSSGFSFGSYGGGESGGGGAGGSW